MPDIFRMIIALYKAQSFVSLMYLVSVYKTLCVWGPYSTIDSFQFIKEFKLFTPDTHAFTMSTECYILQTCSLYYVL